MSIPDVVSASKVSDTTYRSYETDGREPPLSKAAAIAHALGVSLDELAGAKKPAQDELERARYKAMASQGSVTPTGGPTVESYEMLIGYFDFHDRRVSASMLFRASGDPTRFGGWTPPDDGDGDD